MTDTPIVTRMMCIHSASRVPTLLSTSTVTSAAGRLPRQSRLTMSQRIWPWLRCAIVPTPLVSDANAKSVPTAVAGEKPNISVSSGVISEPPPTPVRPTNRPTSKPETV